MLQPYLISLFIGIIAGIIFYLDGWGPSPITVKLSASRRYRAFGTIIGGGIISFVIDKYIPQAQKSDFFFGYLLGVIIGWFVLFTLSMILYVIWKNSRNLDPKTKEYKFGQKCFSILEIIFLGISNNPHLEKERQSQLHYDEVRADERLKVLKQRLKSKDPNSYLVLEEKLLHQNRENIKWTPMSRQKLTNIKVVLQ